MTQSIPHFDLIILGGGLAGASLAAALRGSGRRIAVIEAHAPARQDELAADRKWDTRVYAVSPASVRFLQQIGLTGALDRSRVAPVYDMRIAGDAGGTLHFSAYECGVEALSHIAESSQLSQALWQSLRDQAEVQVFSPAKPAAIHFGRPDAPTDQARLTLDDGRQLSASLIVGADGRDSWARAAARLSAEIQSYEELGVVANFACEQAHRGTAWQWFRQDGVLAWLPLPGRTISIVWSAPLARAKTLLALSPEALAQEVANAGGHRLGKLTPLSSAQGFPLSLMTVPVVVAPRLALIGDAAHGIHPLSGHGINLGFSDAAELARRIRNASEEQEIGNLKFLHGYAKARRSETFWLQQGTHALHQLFRDQAFSASGLGAFSGIPGLAKLPRLPALPVPPGLSLLRNVGLSMTDRISPVKSWLARIAMG